MGDRTPEEVVQRIGVSDDECLDTFEAFRGPLQYYRNCLVIALANVGIDGPCLNGRDENWIDKCVLVAKDAIKLESGGLDCLAIGGRGVGSECSEELYFRTARIELLLFSDSVIYADNPQLEQSEAEEFFRSVDVSDACWLHA